MSMLQIHKNAASQPTALYHEFLIRYRRGKACVWGFVEGKTDPCFYIGKAEHMLPESYDVEFLPAGNRKRVLDLYEIFDWKRFDRRQILFFVDRDLTGIVGGNRITAKNIYVTDNYSIENDLVTTQVCKRTLNELKGLSALRGQEMRTVLDLFEQQLAKYHQYLLPIMANIVAWRRNRQKPSLDNIKMKDLFEIKSGKVVKKKNPGKCKNLPAYLCKKLSTTRRGVMTDYKKALSELKTIKEPKRYVRGKYEIWFLTSFCECIRKEAKSFCNSVRTIPRTSVTLGQNNAIYIVGPRARMPLSLRRFLKRTCCQYVDANEAA